MSLFWTDPLPPELSATPEEVARYRDDGFFVREALFGEPQLAELRDAVERVHAGIVEAAAESELEHIDGKRYQRVRGSTVKWEWRDESLEIRSMEPCHHLDPVLDALIDEPRLWGPARAIIGADQLSLFSDKLNFKRPGGAPFPWHQDGPYWAFDCEHLDRLVSLQLYLDDATRENGCLWMLRKSHLEGALPCYQDRGVLGRLYTDLERVPAGLEAVPLEAPAGSAIFFHGDVVHGSQTNRGTASRRALVLTYQPAGFPRWRHADQRSVGSLSR